MLPTSTLLLLCGFGTMGPLRFEARTALRQAGGGVRRLRFLLREREQRAEGKGRRRACSQIPKRTATSATFTSEQIGDRIEHFAIFSNHSLANNNGLPLLDSSPGAVDGGLPPSSLDEEINMALHQFQEAAPQQLVKLLKTMRMRDPSAPAALWITGLSADLELPSHPHTAAHLAPKSRAKLLALAGLLGVPYTFSSFHGEHIVQDIYPRTEDVEKASVYGSKHPLPMHREGTRSSFERQRQSNLVGGVFTNVSRFRINVLAFSLPLCRLPAVDLTEAIFGSLEMDWRFKDGSIPKRTVPILDRDTSSNSLRLSLFHPEFLPGARMYCENEEAELAYWKLSETAMQRATPIPMRPGDVLIVDNARSVHGRREFEDNSHHSIPPTSLADKGDYTDGLEQDNHPLSGNSASPSSARSHMEISHLFSN